MDYDVIVIGSGFGGAITGARLAEAGCKVLALERGRWWDKKTSADRTAYPRQPDDPWLWDHNSPEVKNGWIDFRHFSDMTVVQGAAVGGGSLIYANISAEAPKNTFERGWPPEITYGELKPYYDTVARFMNVHTIPENQWTARMKLMKKAAEAIGEGSRFEPLCLAVSFSKNWSYSLEDAFNVEKHSERFINQQGVEQGTCVHLGNCDIGCDADAKNTLDRNYIPHGRKYGMEVRQLHLVSLIEPMTAGYRVHFDRLDVRDKKRIPGSHTAARVIIAAGSLGSTELLLRCRNYYKTLPEVSGFLGRNWSGNGDFLTPALDTSDVVSPTKGPTISSAINFLDRSFRRQSFWVEDGGFPDLLAGYLKSVSTQNINNAAVKFLISAIDKLLVENEPFRHVMPWFAQAVDAADGTLSLRRRYWGIFGSRRLHLKWDIAKSKQAIDAVLAMHKKLAAATGGNPLVPPSWALARDLITPHPLGGCNLGTTPENGVVSHAGEVFGYTNLFVADGAVIPEALGVNPSRTIGALAERTAKLIIQSEK